METSEKPKILYHGSPNQNIKEFEPRERLIRDREEGPVIFASPEFSIAACFIPQVKADCGRFGTTVFYVAVKDDFIKNDRGGAVYSISSDTFIFDPEKGMGMMEWISKEKVKPLDKKIYTTSLEAMLESSVQVYLTNEETLVQIRLSSDHGLSILKKLISENQKTNTNIKLL